MINSVSMVLGALDGEAKREVMAVEEEDRDTSDKIVKILGDLYGDTTSVAILRSKLFNCRQKPNQSIRSFSLQLRELCLRLKSKDDTGLGESDLLLRDQFIMGLANGPVRQALKQQVRKTPTLSFSYVQQEAVELESEMGDHWGQATCQAVDTGAQPTPPSDWKQEMRKELLKEVEEQVAKMTKTILEELRATGRQEAPPRREDFQGRRRAFSDSTRANPRLNAPRPGPRLQWDSEGKPVCLYCGEVGHIGRNCPSKQPTHQDF